jgi:hypothetical protein
MSTLEEQFAALPGASEPSLEAEFAALPADERQRSPTAKELAEERRKVEAEYGAEYLRQHPIRAATSAFAQQFAKTTLPFVGEALIAHTPFGTGLSREQQEEVAAASPMSAMAGTATGIVGALGTALATGGVSAEAQLAGRTAATAARVAGAGRGAQALAAGRAALFAPAAGVEAAAPLMAAGSRLAGATEAAITAAAPALRTGIVGRTVTGAVGGGIAAGALGALNEAVESQIEGRELSSEAILGNMKLGSLIGGSVGGVVGSLESLGSAARWVGNTEAGRQYAAKLGKSRAERIYRQHADDILNKVQKQVRPEESYRLINEAADQGLVGVFKDPIEQMNAVRAAKAKSGQLIGRISAEADAARDGAPVDVSRMWDNITDRVIEPMSQRATTADEGAARELSQELERLRNLNGDEMTLADIARVRSEIDDFVFGNRPLQISDPQRTLYYNGLRQFRHALTDRIGQGVQESGIDLATWRAAQRQYQVVSHAERVALKSMSSYAKNNGLDATKTIDDALSIGAALAKGVAPGLGVKLALSGLRYGAPRAVDWARGATERAMRTGAAPRAMIASLRDIADEQAALAEGRLTTLSMRPEDNARTEFLSAYDRINSAIDLMSGSPESFPPTYVDAARRARNELETAYTGLRPPAEAPIVGMSTVLGPDGQPIAIRGRLPPTPSIEQMGNALERARNVFSEASQPTAAAGGVDVTRSFARTQQAANQLMRGMRDDFTGLLADGNGMWGEARLGRAEDELRTLYASHTDPSRLARLQAIQDEAHNVQREIATKADRLMGATGAATRIKPPRRIVTATPKVTSPLAPTLTESESTEEVSP